MDKPTAEINKTMVVLVIDGICLLLFVSMGVYIFALSGEMQDRPGFGHFDADLLFAHGIRIAVRHACRHEQLGSLVVSAFCSGHHSLHHCHPEEKDNDQNNAGYLIRLPVLENKYETGDLTWDTLTCIATPSW